MRDIEICGIDGCRKKMNLIFYICRCGRKTCITHRDPTLHLCSYDYLSENTKKLSEQMVKIDHDKIKNRI